MVVDNCDYRLHERLVREVRRTSSQISLLSLDYNFESVSPETDCLRLNQMEDSELLQLLSPHYRGRLADLDRIVAFAQGFPQMAVLLAEARLNEDPKIGELTGDDLANKLLWRRGDHESQEYLRILQACSLFDVFGIDGDVETQLEHIAGIAEVNIDTAFECIHEYSSRGIIDRRGRYGQVVPKPLAIRLAGQWWSRTRHQRQRELVDGIPENMVDGFCKQVGKLDFHSDVKKLTETLCGPQGPFGQAEVILSVRGSRLFRAFVDVSPEATCAALYATLRDLSIDELGNVEGQTRRNLVWALEKLSYHSELFTDAAWCLLLLATAENESFSNNATGMFSQLFRVQLSGTSAIPKLRFDLLKRALDQRSENVDMILLSALDEAVSTYGGTRTVGAEYQGTKAPLEEWKPKLWQEIFDYWQDAFNLLLQLLDRGEKQKQKVISIIGESIRGFVGRGRIEMLDSAIKHIVSVNGRYWPSALSSIKNVFEYDYKEMPKEAIDALNSWLELLRPDYSELSEKLKIIVVDPPFEHRKKDGGHYEDIAVENVKKFAAEMSKDIESLYPHLDLLLQGSQRQSYVFGREIALGVLDAEKMLDFSLQRVLCVEHTNLSFILGLYSGIFEKDSGEWQLNIDKLLSDAKLSFIYPDAIKTGLINNDHLNTLLFLIKEGVLQSDSVRTLSYGSVTNNLAPEIMVAFCLSLAEVDDKATWVALDIIYMYCFGNKDSFGLIREEIKQLILKISLGKNSEKKSTEGHQWHEVASKLLSVRDEEFAISLTRQLISDCKYGFVYSDLWHYVRPLLVDLMRDYSEVIWPIYGDAVLIARGVERYWLQNLLEPDHGSSKINSSVLSEVAISSVIAWCKDNPDIGPNFVAGCIDVVGQDREPTELFIALLDNFGANEGVCSALSANMHSRSWSGSLVPYLEADKKSLSILLDHKSENVRKWVVREIKYINKQIEIETVRDEEHKFGLY